MQNGQARIAYNPRNGLYIVTWRNHGNDLVPFPRAFDREADAIAFCKQRGLRIV